MATTTPNFGWDIPQSTDLVKDGATAIAALGTDIDTSMVDLKGGTTGQVLSKASNTDMDFTWVAQDDSNAIQNAIVDAKGDLIAASAADTPARLAVGSDGQVLTASSTESTGLKWTTLSTPIAWTPRTGTTETINKIRYANSLWIAVGGNGYLSTSTNGTTWTTRTSGFGTNNIQDVHWNATNALWVAVGQNGTITTSPDGTTWTARTSNMSTNQIYAIESSGSTIVVVGDGGGTTNTGGIAYSTNGTTWTRVNQSITVGAAYNSVVYNGTNWIVGASHSTNNHLYASTPSGTWTAGATGSAGTCVLIAWDGTRTTTVEASGTFRYSTSTTLGTTTASESSIGTTVGQSSPRQFSYYNGRIYWAIDGAMIDFSTVPTNNFYLDQGVKQVIPGIPGLNVSAAGVHVNALGRVLVAKNMIWTSF